MATRKREATIFSYKVILDNEGKLITEITTLPVEDEKVMKDAFSRSREERMFYTSLVKEAKRKLLPIHEWLEKYCQNILSLCFTIPKNLCSLNSIYRSYN